MTFQPIEDDNLSRAWARAFLRVADHGHHEISPFTVNLTGFNGDIPSEDDDLRDALDAALKHSEKQLVRTVANTIFPQSLWCRCRGDRHRLYEQYLEYLPDYVAMDRKRNCKGLYFSRLIAYGIDPKTGEPDDHLPPEKLVENGNQLEYIISRCEKGARKAKFQAALYDPARDVHDGPYQLFPCLQHITFVPDFKAKTIGLNAFYASQQLFVKAYGNWLGLSLLGGFVAGQTGLRFDRLTCFAGIQKMDIKAKPGDHLDRLHDLSHQIVESATIENASGIA